MGRIADFLASGRMVAEVACVQKGGAFRMFMLKSPFKPGGCGNCLWRGHHRGFSSSMKTL